MKKIIVLQGRSAMRIKFRLTEDPIEMLENYVLNIFIYFSSESQKLL